MNQPTGPLAGLRVIDLGVIFAGPLVATNLAELGADTRPVLEELGYGAEDIARLASEGVIKLAAKA